ncbi:MAG: sigma-70 family RNA polymerase sigma factor [Blautia sp.]|nr:sigma-70 family RNA polymerase sigma factor [Blautia sp.]
MTNEELCILAQEGDSHAENELILNLLPMLQALAAKYEALYSGLQIEAADLLQEGSIGFLKAIQSYLPEKGNLFRTYASRVSENAMMDYVRKYRSAVPDSGQMLSLDIEPHNDQDNDESSFYDRLFNEYSKTPEQILIEKEQIEEIHHALKMISPREATYLRYRFGFEDEILHDREETAAHFHLSLSRAKGTERAALDNVRLELPWWY